jgi:hypothetical protein
MITISNRRKGDEFADRVFKNVQMIASQGGISTSSSNCRVYREMAYYSQQREDNIRIDVSVEIWPPAGDRWSLLIAFECKDHNHRVDVNEIERFARQLSQIAPHSCKGIMVAVGNYTKTAINFARNNGIALVRLLPDDQVEYLMYHQEAASAERMSQAQQRDFDRAFSDPEHIGESRDFYGMHNGRYLCDWKTLLTAVAS